MRAVLLLTLWALVLPIRLLAQEAPPDPQPRVSSTPLSVSEVARRVKRSVVVVTVPDRDGREQHLGTGFVISPRGLIATNLHVVGEGRPISVRTADKKRLKVTAVHASDRNLDLALLRVEMPPGGLPWLSLGDSDALTDGAPVVVMGNPLGLKHSVVSGVISGRRELEGRQMLQLAVPIEPGNSGGPVVDLHGRVHGVVTAKSLVKDNLGFAVAINALKPLVTRPNPVPLDRWLTIGRIDAERWTPVFGARWQQRGGRILVEGGGQGFGGRSLCLAKRELPELPFEVAVKVKLDDEGGAAGIVFHADGGNKHYGFYPSNGRLRLSRFEGPNVFTWRVLRELPSRHYRVGEWNELKVRIDKDKLSCFVNDQLLIESRDRAFTSGKVGLAKFRDTKAEFRSFRIGRDLPTSRVPEKVAENIDKLVEQLPALASRMPADLRPLVATAHESANVLERKAKQLEKRAAELKRVAADVRTQDVAARLGALCSPEDFDLVRAGLLIAQLDGEEVEVEPYIAQVERMATEIKRDFPRDTNDKKRLEVLNRYLFKTNGFHGARFDYYHRANSYLNRVIDDRTGLPITLSVLYMEIGRRLGLKIQGVGLPGHFVVKHVATGGEEQVIDVFNEAKLLSSNDVEMLVRQNTGRPLRKSDLKVTSKRAIVLRMLANLLNLAEERKDQEAVLRYLEAQVAVDPEAKSPQTLAARGMRAIVRFNTGRHQAAVADLDWFLDKKPPGLEIERIRQMRDAFLRRSAAQ